jgi:hypothetical protein
LVFDSKYPVIKPKQSIVITNQLDMYKVLVFSMMVMSVTQIGDPTVTKLVISP